MAVGKNQIPSSEFIAKLLQKAGLPSLASIPLSAPPEGTTWSKDQITQMQVEYLHVSLEASRKSVVSKLTRFNLGLCRISR